MEPKTDNQPLASTSEPTVTGKSAGGIAKFQSLFRRRQDPTFNTINPCFIVADDQDSKAGSSTGATNNSVEPVMAPDVADPFSPQGDASFPPIYITNIGGATAVFRSTPPFVNSLSPIHDFLKQRNVRVIVSALSLTNDDDLQKGATSSASSSVHGTIGAASAASMLSTSGRVVSDGRGSAIMRYNMDISSAGGRTTTATRSVVLGTGTASASSHDAKSQPSATSGMHHDTSTTKPGPSPGSIALQRPFSPPGPLPPPQQPSIDPNTINYGYNGSNADEYSKSIQLGFGCVGGSGGSGSGRGGGGLGYPPYQQSIPGGCPFSVFSTGGPTIPGGGLFGGGFSSTPSRTSSFKQAGVASQTPPRGGSGTNNNIQSPPPTTVGVSPLFAPKREELLATPPNMSPLTSPNISGPSKSQEAAPLNFAASVYTPTHMGKSNSFRMVPKTAPVNDAPSALTPVDVKPTSAPTHRSVTFSNSKTTDSNRKSAASASKCTYTPSKEPLGEIPTPPEVIATWVSYCSSLRVFLPSCPDYATVPERVQEEPMEGGDKCGASLRSTRVHLYPYPVYLRVSIPHLPDTCLEDELVTNPEPKQSEAAFPALSGAWQKKQQVAANKWPKVPEVTVAATGTPFIYPITESEGLSEVPMGMVDSKAGVVVGSGINSSCTPPLRAETASYLEMNQEEGTPSLVVDPKEQPNVAPAAPEALFSSEITDPAEKAELGFLMSVIRHHEKALANSLRTLVDAAEERVAAEDAAKTPPPVKADQPKNAWAAKLGNKKEEAAPSAPLVESQAPMQVPLTTIYVPYYYIHVPVEDNHKTRLQSFLQKVTRLMSVFSVPETDSKDSSDSAATKAPSDGAPSELSLPRSDSWAKRCATGSKGTASKKHSDPTQTQSSQITSPKAITIPDVDDDDFDAFFNSQNVTSPTAQHYAQPFPSSAHLSLAASTRKLQNKLFANQLLLQLLLRVTADDSGTVVGSDTLNESASRSAVLTIPNDVICRVAKLTSWTPKSTCQTVKTPARLPSSIIVHCLQGISRSASIVIGFLMRYGHRSFSCDPPTEDGGQREQTAKKTRASNTEMMKEASTVSPTLSKPADATAQPSTNPWFKKNKPPQEKLPQTQVPTNPGRCRTIRLGISITSNPSADVRVYCPVALSPVTYLTALTSVSAARPVINPNPLFRSQLVKFELPKGPKQN